MLPLKNINLICDKCDFKAIEQYQLKQHIRDIHIDFTALVSPPFKKKKDSEIKKNFEVKD